MATIAAAAGGTDATSAGMQYRLTPEKYTTINQLLDPVKDMVLPQLVETYGEQGITGFLKLTGAIVSGGQSDQVDWWEIGRRHRTIAGTLDATSGQTDELVIDGTDESDSAETDPSTIKHVQKNDILMNTANGERYLVTDRQGDSDGDGVTVARLDGAAFSSTDVVSSGTFAVVGNMYAQGTDQPTHFTTSDIIKRSSPFAIVKGRYEVAGSQATNIGWIDAGGGDYRWFMYEEANARKRFEDQREMTMLFGEKNADTAGVAGTIAGTEGYFSALEARGINVSNANANPLDSFSEFDDIILELDKNGAPSEYAMYVNRKQDLAIDDMLANGVSTGTTAGLAGQFGAFNNDADMAVKLGFKSFTRGGYTFHKHDWKLLNDPTLAGAGVAFQGVMVPMSQVADARTGAKAPALSMFYKEANGYSREMEHWVTGGGVLGHNNNGDAGTDQAVFHYRSEIAMCVRAANQHVLIKG
ncbi:putative structural protein [uncultured virus]|uniref:Putative structural protein n=1 Tax=uncultured virus TaxID=340016 RepID=A0A218MMA2_9VIRU|nr:putative structural protein [uncultured virus]